MAQRMCLSRLTLLDFDPRPLYSGFVMRIAPLALVSISMSLCSVVFQTASAAGRQSELTTVFPGATIRLQASMTIDQIRDTSVAGTKRKSRSVRLPVSADLPAPPGYWASFDRIRLRGGNQTTDMAAYARFLRSTYKKRGYKKITVRARPAQQAVEETYYKPASDEWITSKILVLNGKSLIQGFHSVSDSARGTPGAQAMRKVVLSLSPARR